MRVRYWCHHCNTLYGSETVCAQCDHVRCNKCRRYPPKKPIPRVRRPGMDRRGIGASFEHTSPAHPPPEADRHNQAGLSDYLALAPPIVEMEHESSIFPPDNAAVASPVPESPHAFPATITPDTSMPLLYLPTWTGGPEVWRPPKLQVIGRICHECDTFVPTTVAKCIICDHTICIRCPRQPHRPPDPPTDDDMSLDPDHTSRLIMKKHIVRVHHICHQCSRTFEKGSRICAGCSHERCRECPRDPRRKARTSALPSPSRGEFTVQVRSSFEADEPGAHSRAFEVDEEQSQESGQERPRLTDNMSVWDLLPRSPPYTITISSP
jgi:hypothetical protein